MTTAGQRVERYAGVDLYDVLHVTAEASAELVDRAYRLRMLEVHPDQAGTARTDQVALVNAAGEILREPTARAQYDALRTAHRARPGMSQGSPPSRQQGRDPEDERRRRERHRFARRRPAWLANPGDFTGGGRL